MPVLKMLSFSNSSFFFESRVIFYQFKPFIHTTLYELALTQV